jgi:HAMP domain-containing protein
MDSMPGPLRHQPTGQPTTIITRCFLRFASWSLKGKMLALISVILVLLTVSLSVGFVRLSYEQAGRQNDERLQTALVSLDRDLTVRLRNERHQFNEFSNSRPNALLFQGMALTDYSDERQLILSHRLGEGLDADFLMAAYEVDGAMRMRHGFIRDGDHSGIFLTEKDRNIFYAKDSTGLLQEDEANAYRKGLLLRMQAFTEESHAVSSLLQGTNIGQAEVLSLETIDGELYLVSSRDYVSRFEDRSYRLEVGDSLGRYVSFTRIGPLLTKLADDLDMDMAIHRADGSHLPGYGHFGDLPAGAADLDNRKFDMNGGDGDRYDARTFPLVAIDYPAGVVATAGIHWSDTTEEIQDVLILFMVIAGASLLVTLPVGFIFLSRFIADPIRQLAGAAEHMGKGRWETELPPIRRNDEIGELHSAFGRMAADLGSMWADLQDKIGELARSEAGLREARDNLEVAVDERTAELHEAQQRLVALAHQAGRAEVASSVLHNVGNVLTTVVATHYGINKRFRNSRINILTQVGTAMDEQEDPYEQCCSLSTATLNGSSVRPLALSWIVSVGFGFLTKPP